MAVENEIPELEQGKLETVLLLLRDCQDPRLVALHDKADALAHPDAEVAAVRKFEGEVVALRKSDPNLSRSAAMERVWRENPGLQRELAEASGTGADLRLRDPAYR